MTGALHLHGIHLLDRPVEAVVDDLLRDGQALAEAATLAAVAATWREGAGFRVTAEPRVDVWLPYDGMATLNVSWNDDEERWPPAGRFPFASDPTSPWWHREEEHTGWPTMVLQIVVTPTDVGTRLAVLSTRTPGVDTTTNRIDRHRRDRLARRAVEHFLAALAGLLTSVEHRPAVAS